MGRLIDLSHIIESGMPRFQAFPEPQIAPFWTHEESRRSGHYEGCTCEVTQVAFVTSLGTYLDAPFHFDPRGVDIGGLPLEKCVLEGVCLDVRPRRAGQGIEAHELPDLDYAGKAVLLCTGWSALWGQPAYYHHPFVTAGAARALARQGIGMLGIDTLVADDTSDPTRPVHNTLLRSGIPIVENLTNLEALLGRAFTFYAVPPRVRGAAAFPVRAFALLEE